MKSYSQKVVVTEEEVQGFQKATLTQTSEVPLTFSTKYRDQEFELLRSLNVDFHELLHLEQGYQYLEPIKVGDSLEISSRISENKIKKNMQFITLETLISSGSQIKVISESKMVVRMKEGIEK